MIQLAICDDEPQTVALHRRLAEEALQAIGAAAAVTTYTSSENLLADICDDGYFYDLILLDIEMPGVDGMALVRNGIHGFRVALTGFEDCFIGEKFTHSGSPPFPRAAAARQAGYAAPLCCVFGRYVRRSLAAAGAGSSSAKSLPVSALAGRRARRQERRYRAGRSGRRR